MSLRGSAQKLKLFQLLTQKYSNLSEMFSHLQAALSLWTYRSNLHQLDSSSMCIWPEGTPVEPVCRSSIKLQFIISCLS